MGDIFVSYSSANRDFALEIAERLEQFYAVWIDREGIEGGMEWEEAIVNAVTNCITFLVIVTPESNESNWVARETILAEQLKKHCVPILLAGELPFRLLNLHYIDFQGDFEGGFRDLLEALNQHLQPQDKVRTAVNQLLGEAIRAQLAEDAATARNFIGQALAIQPDLSPTVAQFWQNLNQKPKTHYATLLQNQLNSGNRIIIEVARLLDNDLYDDKRQAFEWSLRIHTGEDILDEIEYVRYQLHPTYVNPERIIRDRKSRFQLRMVGWGTFGIPIKIQFKDGSTVQTHHNLKFPTLS